MGTVHHLDIVSAAPAFDAAIDAFLTLVAVS